MICGADGPLGSPDCQRPKGHAGDHQSSDSEMLSSWPADPTPGEDVYTLQDPDDDAYLHGEHERCTGGCGATVPATGWEGEPPVVSFTCVKCKAGPAPGAATCQSMCCIRKVKPGSPWCAECAEGPGGERATPSSLLVHCKKHCF